MSLQSLGRLMCPGEVKPGYPNEQSASTKRGRDAPKS